MDLSLNKSRLLKYSYIPVSILFFLISIHLSTSLPFNKILIVISSLILVFLIFKFPEIGFTIFLLTGIIKDITQSFPIDFTLLIFILTLFSMLYKLVTKQYKIHFSNKYVFLFFLFVSMLLISNLYTKSPDSGFLKTIRFSVFNTFLFLGGISMGLTPKTRMRFLRILHFLIFIYSLIYVYFLKNMIGMNFKELANYHLRLSLVGNPIGVGRIFSVLSLISIICLFYEKNKYKKIFYILSTILGLFITISTNSRGPFFALIISILIYLFFFTKVNRRKIVYALILVSLLFTVIFTLLPENFVSRYKLLGNREVHISKNRSSAFNTFIIRENYIKKSLDYLNENPEKSIFGVGLGGFSYIITNRDIRVYPHNIFVEIILELGILGLILFMLPFLFLLNDFLITKNKISNEESKQIIFWIMLVIIFFLNAQVSGDINDNRLLWFFQGGVVGLILQYKKEKNLDIIK